MSACKFCGAEIDWIFTTEQKYKAVDPEPVFVIEGGGQDQFIEDEGGTITGRIARPEEERRDLPVAYVPHWGTCRNTASFRRRKGGETNYQ